MKFINNTFSTLASVKHTKALIFPLKCLTASLHGVHTELIPWGGAETQELQVTLIVPVKVQQERIYCPEHAVTACKEQREGRAGVSPSLWTNWGEPNGLWRVLGEGNEL